MLRGFSAGDVLSWGLGDEQDCLVDRGEQHAGQRYGGMGATTPARIAPVEALRFD